MKKLLYIDCCIRRDGSRTKKLADHFMAEVVKTGAYEVETLCLMDEDLSYFSEGFFNQREELIAAGKLEHPRFRYARQFAEADKIVIAAPFWDLSFPALLKVYIENLCVDKITFTADATGLHGLCKADHMVFLTTRGSFYTNNPMEMGSRYLEALCGFFGIDTYDCVAADGLDTRVRPVEDILADAYVEAEKVAQRL